MWLSGSRFRNRIGWNGRAYLPVLRHLALDRHDVREDVAMCDDHALGFGRRARGEDDLGGRRRASMSERVEGRASRSTAPSAVVEQLRADVQTGRVGPERSGVDDVADQDGLRVDDRRRRAQEVGRCAVVDRHEQRRLRAGSPRARRSIPAGSRSRSRSPVRARCRRRAGAARTRAPRRRRRRSPRPRAIAVVVDEKLAGDAARDRRRSRSACAAPCG